MKTLNRLKIYGYGFILSVSILFSCSKTTDTPPPVFTVSTTPATLITATTARSGGSITVTSGTPVIIEKGVCYSTSANPTITSYTVPIVGTSVAIYTSDITGLTANTTYHVRAYTVDASGAKYGENVTFTTNSTPVVTTAATSSITQTTATSGGNVTSDNGSAVTEKGVCYATTQNPTTSSTKITSGTGTGSFVSNLTDLSVGTTYYVRAYAINGVGTAYGSQVSFTTLQVVSTIPTLTTSSVSSIMGTSATSGGTITSGGGAFVYARGVCWSTSANPTINDSKTTDGTDVGSFTSSITGLTPNTTYHVRAYATNNVGTAYGSNVTFTTSALAIGTAYQGGIVFYLDGNGGGLIAATIDQSTSIQWNDNLTTPAGAYGVIVGTGESNTIQINNVISGTFAARTCTNYNGGGYNDWFLPSKDELGLIYTNLKLNNLGNLSGIYWSSTETGNATAWVQLFTANFGFPVGSQIELGKTQSYSVRAIRSF